MCGEAKCSEGKMNESLCAHSSRVIRCLKLVAFLQEFKKKKKALQMKSLNQVMETQNCYVGISSLQLSLTNDMVLLLVILNLLQNW